MPTRKRRDPITGLRFCSNCPDVRDVGYSAYCKRCRAAYMRQFRKTQRAELLRLRAAVATFTPAPCRDR